MSDAKKALGHSFKNATLNRCAPSELNAKIPICPKTKSEIAFLDARFPTGALFIHYLPLSTVFLSETLKAFHQTNPTAVANVLVTTADVASLIADRNGFGSEIDQKWVNLIPIVGSADYAKWTRDIFRFTEIGGKPALFHMNYGDESKLKLVDNTPCEISRQCGFPYEVQEDLVSDSDPLQGLGIDSGGNLGASPGGSIYRGVIGTAGFNDNRDLKISKMALSQSTKAPKNSTYPVLTPVQRRNTVTLHGARVDFVNLDTSFLYVGHADELLSIIKTQDPEPCNFAILRPSLERAIKIIESSRAAEVQDRRQSCIESKLSDQKNRHFSDGEYLKAVKTLCVDGVSLESFQTSVRFQKIKDDANRRSIELISSSNAKLAIDRIAQDTNCKVPIVIDVPILFEGGKSFFPNQVNLLELNPVGGNPAVIVARSFFLPFDLDFEASLKKRGVEIHYVNDLSYAIEGGDVHCGTNELRLCKTLETR